MVSGALLLSFLGAALGVGQGTATGAPHNSYGSGRAAPAVALGDSFASGEGLAPYQAGTDTTTNRCHRSELGYPSLLNDRRSRGFERLRFVACSGAKTGAILADVPDSSREPAQVGALKRTTRTVTLTVGGNDLGFSTVLGDCVFSPVNTPEVQQLVPGRPDCASRWDTEVDARIAWLAGRKGSAARLPGTVPMPKVLRAVSRKAPKARIYVTGYPRLFGLTFPAPGTYCQVGQLAPPVPLLVTASDAVWIRSKVDALNAAIKSSVQQARRSGIRATYVDVAEPFTTHNLCASSTPWINGVVFTATNPPQVATASFHPNALGQRAYADAVARAVPGRG